MIYEFLAVGFEVVEALTPYDMLLRAGADIKTVSLNIGKTVTGAHGVRIEADITLDEAAQAPDAVVLPGGMPGAKNLRESETVCRMVSDGNTVTAAGMGVALEFGAELITVIYGSEKAAEVLRSVMAQ